MAVGDVLIQRLSGEFGTTFSLRGDELLIGGPAPGTPPPLRAPEVPADELRYVSEHEVGAG